MNSNPSQPERNPDLEHSSEEAPKIELPEIEAPAEDSPSSSEPVQVYGSTTAGSTGQADGFYEKRIQPLVNRARNWVEENPRRAWLTAGAIVLLIISFILPVDEPHVSLAGQPLRPGGWVTNSLFTTFIVDLIVIGLALLASRRMQLVPSGLQNAMEAMLEYLYNLCQSVTGSAARRYFPLAATIFFFVLISNWIGLIPGVGSIGVYYHETPEAGTVIEDGALHEDELRQAEPTAEPTEEQSGALPFQISTIGYSTLISAPPSALQQQGEGEGLVVPGEVETETEVEAEAEGEHAELHFVPLFRAPSADLNMTFALALIVMVLVQYYGVRSLGVHYFDQFHNFSGKGAMRFVNGFVSVLELLAQFVRLIAFAFRLFGNIFAGEVVLATMAFLVAFLVPIPFYMLELLVGAVQALVFMMLTLAFFSIATVKHEH